MNDLITVRECAGVMPSEAEAEVRQITADIAHFERELKAMKEKEDDLKKRLLEAMEEHHISKLQSEEISITYVAETERETFDSKKFRSDHADLYDEYINFSPVKASIRIKVR
jgi:regulator of replication initiation timing